VVGKDHGHVAPVRGERGCKLGADEAATDHGGADSVAGETAQAPVVVERPVVDDAAVVVGRQAPRRAARREQDVLVRVRVARVVGCRARAEIELDDASSVMDLDIEIGRAAPHGALLLAGPECLRQRRAGVRVVLLGREHRDRPLGIVMADPAARRVTRHPPADNQVAIRHHRFLPAHNQTAIPRSSAIVTASSRLRR
jgi:hypothetical protein